MNISFPIFEKYSYIPVIAGPTASGKSALALEICRLVGGGLDMVGSVEVGLTNAHIDDIDALGLEFVTTL